MFGIVEVIADEIVMQHITQVLLREVQVELLDHHEVHLEVQVDDHLEVQVVIVEIEFYKDQTQHDLMNNVILEQIDQVGVILIVL